MQIYMQQRQQLELVQSQNGTRNNVPQTQQQTGQQQAQQLQNQQQGNPLTRPMANIPNLNGIFVYFFYMLICWVDFQRTIQQLP